MKNLMTVLILSASALGSSAFATAHKEAPDMAKSATASASAGASAPMGHRQSKMGDCNKQAADKTGDERKAFMKTCLSAKPAGAMGSASAASQAVVAASGTPQQAKMKACNADAKTQALKGEARRAFMKECLSK